LFLAIAVLFAEITISRPHIFSFIILRKAGEKAAYLRDAFSNGLILPDCYRVANPGGEVLVELFGGGVPPASPNPDPISDLKIPFSIPVFRPHLVLD